MIELTEQQARALENPEATPPRVLNPRTRETFILLRLDEYERLKTLLALDDYDPDDAAAYVNEVMAEDDANDPLLESYQKYGKTP
jgi:hypothetical protein